MHNIERRLAAMAATNMPADQFTIIRRMVSPGQLDAEIYALRGDDGNFWARQLGETEQELIDRASIEVKRSPWGVARLITASADECRDSGIA